MGGLPCGNVGYVSETAGADVPVAAARRRETNVGNMVWKVLGTGSAIVAGIVANKVIGTIWQKAGRDLDIDPNNPDSPVVDAVLYAAVAGVAVGLARTMATRKAAQFYQRSAGHLPQGMDDSGKGGIAPK